jgi:hypothetical protein
MWVALSLRSPWQAGRQAALLCGLAGPMRDLLCLGAQRSLIAA